MNQVDDELLDELLGTLDKRARYAVKARFGLIDGERKSFREVGEELGVTAEAARRLVNRAVAGLRGRRGQDPGCLSHPPWLVASAAGPVPPPPGCHEPGPAVPPDRRASSRPGPAGPGRERPVSASRRIALRKPLRFGTLVGRWPTGPPLLARPAGGTTARLARRRRPRAGRQADRGLPAAGVRGRGPGADRQPGPCRRGQRLPPAGRRLRRELRGLLGGRHPGEAAGHPADGGRAHLLRWACPS